MLVRMQGIKGTLYTVGGNLNVPTTENQHGVPTKH
jgi:hypothetical protein